MSRQGGAWGSGGVSSAVRAPPAVNTAAPTGAAPQHNKPSRNQNKRNNQGRGGRGGGRNKRNTNNNNNNNNGNRGGNAQNNKQQQQQQQQQRNSNKRTSLKVDMWTPGSGATPAQQKVIRIPVETFLQMRLQYMDQVLPNIPEECIWNSKERKDEIARLCAQPRKGGDVSSKKDTSTAPPLEDCKPLEINEETRWKKSNQDDKAKLLLVLNKLSLTNLDKLARQFTDQQSNEDILPLTIRLLVEKAQAEPHFAPMYATFCSKLYQLLPEQKLFKKNLLAECQREFEEDMDAKIAKAIQGITDKEEIELQTNICRKNYIGHMQFLGELYKLDMIKFDIMVWCLKNLFVKEEDDKLECFCKLLSTIGPGLEQQAKIYQQKGKVEPIRDLDACWEEVLFLAGKKQDETGKTHIVSNRIKFMFQDLIDMKENGWKKRRQEETAKTIAQIHKEVEREEKAKTRNSLRRSVSDAPRVKPTPKADTDGFIPVVPAPSKVLRRSQSDTTGTSSTSLKKMAPRKSWKGSTLETIPAQSETATPTFPDVNDCSKKAQNIFKEYFVSGETDDAVLSIHEIVGVGHEGSQERGAKVVEGSILLVLEMKQEQVDKVLLVLKECLKQGKLEAESIAAGLVDPLDFLNDIEIDAPLAGTHLARMVAELIRVGSISFDLLLEAPDYFLSDGKPALFATKVLKQRGGDITDADVEIVSKLMTDRDKESFGSVKELMDSV